MISHPELSTLITLESRFVMAIEIRHIDIPQNWRQIKKALSPFHLMFRDCMIAICCLDTPLHSPCSVKPTFEAKQRLVSLSTHRLDVATF